MHFQNECTCGTQKAKEEKERERKRKGREREQKEREKKEAIFPVFLCTASEVFVNLLVNKCVVCV